MRKIGFLSLGFFLATQLFAGVTGKIAGKVIDKSTGELLPFANVTIEGTTMGAATDAEGFYYILNVPVGTYSVKASMMGYESVTKTGVKSFMDLTTTINFELEPTVIKAKAVTVTAKRPMIIPDATSTMHVITAKEIERQPVHSARAIVSQQAGVVNSAGGASGATGGLHIRGGRSDEVTHMVDGMSIQDPVMGQVGAVVNMNAVQEVMVITGGFNAEYGEAMSGVVNLVTKEGGGKHEGLVKYRSDRVFADALDQGFEAYETSLGGPLGFLKNANYFLSGEVSSQDHWQSYYFAVPLTDKEFYSFQGKLTYKINPSIKVGIGGFLSRTQRGQYGIFAGLPDTDQQSENQEKYQEKEDRLTRFDKARQIHATLTHMITKSTFYTFNLGYFKTQLLQGHRDWNYEEGRHWWQDVKFRPWWTYNEYPTRMTTAPYDTIYPYGVAGGTQWGFVHGGVGFWRDRESSYINAKFDLTSQILKHHQVKFGIEAKRNDAKYVVGQAVYTREDTTSQDITKSLYFDEYEYYPMQGAIYLQDKIEYPGFIINAGLRLDYLDPAAQKFEDPYSPSLGKVDAKSKYKLSPRFGMSYPVTERTVFHLSYGQFFQVPELRRLYEYAGRNLMEMRGGWIRLGNPDLAAQKTTQYEIGIAHQFLPTLAINLTTYYKDLYDILAARLIPAQPKVYTIYEGADYGNIKGLELVITKRREKYFSGKLSYGLSEAKGTGSYSTQAYYDYIANIPPDPVTGRPVVLPQKEFYLEFDQRHTISMSLNFEVPDKCGPLFGSIYPLQNLNLNILTQAGSGLPYTVRDASMRIVGGIYSKRMPWTMTTDLKVEKRFNFSGVPYSVFCEVTNLFNAKNILNVYPVTGKPDDSGMMYDYDRCIGETWPKAYIDKDAVPCYSSSYDARRDLDKNGEVTKGEWYQSYVNCYKDYIDDPYIYGSPRRIQIGISLNF
ncbi:TonB-dependent receptor [candidate division WOR-3 bacterium]|nr:TonB-dependent receptor [candidate division WOR-3 bacterium]